MLNEISKLLTEIHKFSRISEYNFDCPIFNVSRGPGSDFYYCFVIVLIAMTAALSLYAQDSPKTPERTSGFRAGFSAMASTIDGSEDLAGFYAGFAHDSPLGRSRFLYYHGGAEYAQAGWSFNDDTFNRLHYISLPGSLKAKFGPAFVQAGLALNFKVAERIYVDKEDVKTDDNKSKIFNLPVLIGAGLQLGPVVIDVRFNYGLMKINEPGDHSGYFQLGAGLLF